jgi:hypothetical protein
MNEWAWGRDFLDGRRLQPLSGGTSHVYPTTQTQRFFGSPLALRANIRSNAPALNPSAGIVPPVTPTHP